MAKSGSYGYTAAAATKNIAVPDIDFETQFTVDTFEPTKVGITNLTSPTDQADHLTFQYMSIADVYKGSSIDPSVYSPNRKGISVATVLKDVMRVTDSGDPSYQMDLPIKVSLSVVLPQNPYLNASAVDTAIKRCFAAWYPKGAVTTARIDALIRGSMKPSEI